MSNMKKKPIVTIRLSAILRVRRRRRKGGPKTSHSKKGSFNVVVVKTT